MFCLLFCGRLTQVYNKAHLQAFYSKQNGQLIPSKKIAKLEKTFKKLLNA